MQNVQAKIYRECLYVYKKVNRRYNKLYHFKYKVGGHRINIVSDTLIFNPESNSVPFLCGGGGEIWDTNVEPIPTTFFPLSRC